MQVLLERVWLFKVEGALGRVPAAAHLIILDIEAHDLVELK